MQAKVIKTGEIVDVYHETQHGQVSNIYKEAVLVNGRMWTEDELDFSINSKSKDVDLEKEIENEIDEYWYDNDYGAIQRRGGTITMEVSDVKEIARHFFELGLAQKGEKV